MHLRCLQSERSESVNGARGSCELDYRGELLGGKKTQGRKLPKNILESTRCQSKANIKSRNEEGLQFPEFLRFSLRTSRLFSAFFAVQGFFQPERVGLLTGSFPQEMLDPCDVQP
jgi:hypothetical protein